MVLLYLGAAFAVTGRFWVDLSTATPAVNPQDHVFFQWVLAHGAQVAEHGIYPFTTKSLNMPDGVNLMANTSCSASASRCRRSPCSGVRRRRSRCSW